METFQESAYSTAALRGKPGIAACVEKHLAN
jgi:hypothetical protein